MAIVRKRRLRKNRDGKARYAYQVRWYAPDGQRHSRTFGGKAVADAFASALEASKARGEYRDPNLGSKERLGEFYESRWLSWAAQRLSPSTLTLMTDQWRLSVGPALAKRKLGSLTRLDLQTLLESIASRRTPYQAETSLRLLRSILKAAVDDGLLARSVAHDVKAPKRPPRKVRYLSREEVDTLAAATPDRWRALVLVAAFGGLRFGELAGLRTGHIDFPRRKLLVDGAVVEAGGRLHVRPTKSGRARTITLPAFVMDALADHLERWPPGSDGLVFADEAGGPLWRSNFYKRAWWPALKRAKIGHLRFHDLRHTSAALAIAQGAHPKTIQMRLGHHSAAFTLDVYGGLFESLDEDLAERLNAQGPTQPAPESPPGPEGQVIPFPKSKTRRHRPRSES